MKRSDQVTPITIRDIGFTVARQIEQCPKTMMRRELVMNAVEAAAKAPKGRQVVEIKGKEVLGARKLTIWNTGPGMSSVQLDHICDLAASLGKDMHLEGNSGMGAKVASLPSNTLGMRYRSCHRGIVSEVILGKREGIYGKIRREIEGAFEDVIDVTAAAKQESEYDLNEDWTEVVLLGRRAAQDTVADPYDGDPKQDKQWLSTYLDHRFYRIPPDVELYLNEKTQPGGRRPFRPIPDRADRFGRAETVNAESGIKLHYYFDPSHQDGHKRSVSGSLASSAGTAALVYRGEMYDVRRSRKWAADAPAFGIPFGGKHISVHVELPDNFPARHEPYRQFIRLMVDDQRQLNVDHFASLVSRHRPGWLKEVINSFAPKASASTEDLRKELQELLNELRIRVQSPRLAADGAERVEQGDGRGATPVHANGVGGGGERGATASLDLILSPGGAKRAAISTNLEQAPLIDALDDEEQIAEKGIAGKAARYVPETNRLFINLKYPSVAAAREHLERRYATHPDPELVRSLAREWAERIATSRVGHAVVYAKAKQLVQQWTSDDVKKALVPESLSLAADGWRDAASGAYHSISRRLGTSAATPKGAAGSQGISAHVRTDSVGGALPGPDC